MRPKCPRCANRQVYRSHRRTLLDLFFYRFLDWRPYRCHACKRRFHASSWHHHHAPESLSNSYATQNDEAAGDTVYELRNGRNEVYSEKAES
jgi:hypothetical protein